MGGLACGSDCTVVDFSVVLHEPATLTTDACTMTLEGSSHTAVLRFDRVTTSPATCDVASGPAPEMCLREHCNPGGECTAPLYATPSDSPPGREDTFAIEYGGTAASDWFGEGTVSVSLSCGDSVEVSHEPHVFQCVHLD
jgi:hypothetical protein